MVSQICFTVLEMWQNSLLKTSSKRSLPRFYKSFRTKSIPSVIQIFSTVPPKTSVSFYGDPDIFWTYQFRSSEWSFGSDLSLHISENVFSFGFIFLQVLLLEYLFLITRNSAVQFIRVWYSFWWICWLLIWRSWHLELKRNYQLWSII